MQVGRDIQGEGRAFSRPAFHRDLSFMQFGVLAHQMETYAAALPGRLSLRGCLIETVENEGQILFRNAASGVFHPDRRIRPSVFRYLLQRDPYLSVRGGEFEGIGKQVVEHLIHLVGIVIHEKTFHFRLEGKFYLTACRQVGELPDSLFQKKDHIVHLQPETLALHFQFTEIEQLVYQIEQAARIIVNRFQLLFQLRFARIVDECPQRRKNQGEGSAELMADVREEAELHLVELFALFPFVGFLSHPDFELCPPPEPSPRPDHQTGSQHDVHRDGPCRRPKRWRNGNGYFGRCLPPNLVSVGGVDHEFVLAGL